MQSKSLLIAIAAFAVTATSASAFSGAVLSRANLTDDQRIALEQARELRQNGDNISARDILVEAGIDETVLTELRLAAKKAKKELHKAVAEGDYETFQSLVAGTPLGDIVTSVTDFTLLQDAHTLRQSGEHEAAREILEELGITQPRYHRGLYHAVEQLTDEQKEALRVAKQANDKKTVRAILNEAGIEKQ